MKDTLFKQLEKLKGEIFEVEDSDKPNGKNILVGVDEIVSQFNKGKYPEGPKDLDLDEADLNKLRIIVDEIWDYAETRHVDIWPKPDIVFRIG